MSESSALTSPGSEHSVPVRLADDDDVNMESDDALEPGITVALPHLLSPKLSQQPVVVAPPSPPLVALPSQAVVLPAGPGGFGRHRGLLLSRPASAQSYHSTTATNSPHPAAQQPVAAPAATQASADWQRTIRRPTAPGGGTPRSRPHSFHAGDAPSLDVVADHMQQPSRAGGLGNLHPADPTLFDGGLPTAMPALFTAKATGADTPSAYLNHAMQTQQQQHYGRPSAMQRFDDQRPATSPSLRSYADGTVPAFGSAPTAYPHPYPPYPPPDPRYHQQHPQYAVPPSYGTARMHSYPQYAPGGQMGYGAPFPHYQPTHGQPPHGPYASHWRPVHPPSQPPAGAYGNLTYGHPSGRPMSSSSSSFGAVATASGAPSVNGGSACDPLAIQQHAAQRQVAHARGGSDWSATSSVDSRGRRSLTHGSSADAHDADAQSAERELEDEVDIMRLEQYSGGQPVRMEGASDDSDAGGESEVDDDDDDGSGEWRAQASRRRSSAARTAPAGYFSGGGGGHPYASSVPAFGAPSQHPGYAISYGGPPHGYGLAPPPPASSGAGYHQPSTAPPAKVVRLKVVSPSSTSSGGVVKKKKKPSGGSASRAAKAMPAPVPVPNLNKRSRGRHVPLDEDEVLARKGGNGKTFQCEVCYKWFGRGEHLKRCVPLLPPRPLPSPCLAAADPPAWPPSPTDTRARFTRTRSRSRARTRAATSSSRATIICASFRPRLPRARPRLTLLRPLPPPSFPPRPQEPALPHPLSEFGRSARDGEPRLQQDGHRQGAPAFSPISPHVLRMRLTPCLAGRPTALVLKRPSQAPSPLPATKRMPRRPRIPETTA